MHLPARTKMDQDQSQVIMLCASLSAPRSHRCHTGNKWKIMWESATVSSLAPPPESVVKP